MNEIRKLTINQAIAESGLSNNYIRKAIASGALEVTKELVPGTTNNWRNVILNWDEWRATRTHSQREDGRNKYVLYATESEMEDLRALLASGESPLIDLITRANQKPAETE